MGQLVVVGLTLLTGLLSAGVACDETLAGSEAAGILAGMDEPPCHRPGYRDREDSRFYQARGLSPEQTWQALGDELARVLDDARRAFWRVPLRLDPERVRWWHGAIFARCFPRDGGCFRRDRAFFGVATPNGGMRQLEGVAPEAIHSELQAVCSSFNRYADALGDPNTTGVLDRTRAVAALYAGILRVHPFVDGNHRVSFVALSTALWSFGLPNIEFEDDAETIAHDDALVPALESKHGSIKPFAQLLADLIQHSMGSRA
ncbi:MAG: Fic family protein [Solirubrobacteraceae bacterium]